MSLRPPALRPPGAGQDFAARCIRCGRCVVACPYRTLVPAGFDAGRGVGAPEVRPRTAPCTLCLACPPVCPTGALAPIRDPRAVRMGRAVVELDRCYAAVGVLCRTCVDECPLQGEALRQDSALRPVVTDACVGCGLCEFRCPADPAAIVVVPAGGA